LGERPLGEISREELGGEVVAVDQRYLWTADGWENGGSPVRGRLPFCKSFEAMSKDIHLGLRVLRVQGEGCVFLMRVLHPPIHTPVTLRAATPGWAAGRISMSSGAKTSGHVKYLSDKIACEAI